MDGARQDKVSASLAYSIIHVPHDETSIRKYINDYKTFRLMSLQLAPSAFASTYAREVAFEDSVWFERLSNPMANTFLAVGEAGQIFSTSTLMGPLSHGTHFLPHLGNPCAAFDDWEGNGPLHFRLNAIFTMPEARRKGISKSLIERSIEYATDEARAKNKDVIFSVIVSNDNLIAKALYESVGFLETIRLGQNVLGLPLIILEYKSPVIA